MKIIVNRMNNDQSDRIFQLINKTNQFNLTTTRYSPNEFSQFFLDTNKYVFVANVEDKFSNEGLVFVMIGTLIENSFYIDNIVMSCRVMGRNIEYSVYELIEKHLFTIGVEYLYGKYIPTNKNKPVQELFNKFAYEPIEKFENVINYRKRLDNNFVKAITKAKWKNEN